MQASHPPPTARRPAGASAVLAPVGAAPRPVGLWPSPAPRRPLTERDPRPVAPLRGSLPRRARGARHQPRARHQCRAGRLRLVGPWGSPPPPVTAQPRARARRYPSHPHWSVGRLPNLHQPSGARGGGPTLAVRPIPLPMSSELLPDTPPRGRRSRVRALPGSATIPSALVAPRRRVRRGSGLARPRVQPGRAACHLVRAGATARVRAEPARPAPAERGRILA
jgi:hypothetical protein